MSKPKDHDSTEDLLSDLLGPDFMATGMAKPRTNATPETTPTPAATPKQEPTQAETTAATEAAIETTQTTEGEAPARRRRTRAGEPTAQKQQKAGVGAMVGAACLFGGILATVLQGSNAFTTTLRSIGLDAPLLLTIGAVVFVLSIVRRQHALAQIRYEQLAQAQNEKESELHGSLQYLVEQQQISSERPPAEGEELQRVLVSLQRQDEKVGNLTKALKMYGKPLMEIATQGNEIAAQIQQLKQQLEAVQQGIAKSQQPKTEAAVDLTPVERKLAETQKELLAAVATLAERMPKDAGVLPLLQRIEQGLSALTQRIDDSDTKKAITRLEETHRAQTQKLDKLADQASVHEEMQRLERVVDATVGKLTHTVDQVRDKDLGGLENTVREIQREVTGLGNSISSLQQTIRAGAAPRATTPASYQDASVSQPTHAAEEPRHSPQMAGAAAATHAPSPSGSTNDAQAGVAENRTGTRAASSKNVLGAIAKLKQMKH